MGKELVWRCEVTDNFYSKQWVVTTWRITVHSILKITVEAAAANHTSNALYSTNCGMSL